MIEKKRIGEIADIIMGQSPKGSTYNNERLGIALLNGPTEFGLYYPTCTLFTTDSKRESKKGDIIFCVRGSTTGRMNCADQKYSLGRGVCAIRGNSQLDTKYIRYCLDKEIKALLQFATGSTFPNLSRDDISNFIIPYSEYRLKIAAILSAYDDLIENNTRRIKILEEMAQAIYREWFVNFRFPGHEGVQMVESELGLIPEGWKVNRLDEVAEVIDCLHGKKPSEVENDDERFGILLHVWNIGEEGKLDLSKKFYVSKEVYELWTKRIEVQEGDCVITNVGRIGAVAQIPFNQKAAIGRNMTAIRYLENYITPTFLIEYLRSPHFEKEKSLKQDLGTVMGSLNVKGIVKLAIQIPPLKIVEEFEKIARPLRYNLEILQNKNSNLRNTRDLLLPKLISGELDVSDLDIPIPEAE